MEADGAESEIITMAQQEIFIRRIRKALEKDQDSGKQRSDILGGPLPREYQDALEAVRSRTPQEHDALIRTLMEKSATLNIRVSVMPDTRTVSDAIASLICERDPEWGDRRGLVAWKHPLVEALNLHSAMASLSIPIRIAETDCSNEGRTQFRKDAGEALLGVTSADYCIAESATLVIKSRPGHPRSASLLPTIHAAVVRSDQILKNTRELYALFSASEEGLGNSTILVTGPSKTADIEATLVHGAHGPRELHLFILTDQTNRSDERK